MLQKIKNIDYTILLIMACFGAIGTAAIYSSTVGTKFEGMHMQHAIMFGAFFVPMMMAAFINYRFLTGYMAYFFYALGIGLLLLVMIKGENYNGAERWIQIAGTQFQPSELVKIVLILITAHWLQRREGEPLRFFKDVIPLGLLFIVPILLVYKQPDLGTALVFVSIFVGMLWIGNVRWTHMLIGSSLFSGLVGGVIWLYNSNHKILEKLLSPRQIARIQTFLDPASDPDNAWHVLNSIRAVGSGQLAGKGYMNGSLVQNGFIPYSYSDSIYVVIGEEFGFLGSAALLLLYFFLIYRLVIAAMESRDLAGTYITVGVISMFVWQIFENVAMHIGLMPLTGIALPFVSYGGSSLLTNMAAIGLVLSVKMHKGEETAR